MKWLETIFKCSQSERYSLEKYLKSGSFCHSPRWILEMLKISWENVGSNIKDMSWSLVVSATCCNWQKIAQISYFLWHLTGFTVFLEHELITKMSWIVGIKYDENKGEESVDIQFPLAECLFILLYSFFYLWCVMWWLMMKMIMCVLSLEESARNVMGWYQRCRPHVKLGFMSHAPETVTDDINDDDDIIEDIASWFMICLHFLQD